MLDLPSSSPYTSGHWLDYHAKLPPSLQQNLDSAVLVTNSVGQTITLDNAIQLVAQFAAWGTSHVPSTSEHAPAPSFRALYQAPTPTDPAPIQARHPDSMDLSHM